MSDILLILFSWTMGLVTGLAYYGGLWLTVRKSLVSRHPAVWFASSLIVRIALVAASFLLLSNGSWQRLLLGLAGFIIARPIVIRLTRCKQAGQPPTGKEDDA